MASEAPQSKYGFDRVLFSWRIWWRTQVVDTVDQAAVIATRREESDITARYLLMLAMSAGIAILGMLLSSPAVVIGAMLLSPLMGPIIGLGFALATGNFGWTRQAAKSLAVGTALSILFCALVVYFSPIQTVTSEIAARTKPNLFDLLVAVFSGIAGAYAMIRGRAGAVVGVAIATALMPPLAVVGFGLATLNWTVFSGALLLYVTNLMTIALISLAMARLYGFRTSLSEVQTHFQSFLVVATLIGLAIPLGFSLDKIRFEANATRQINRAVEEAFGDRARISQIDVNYNTEPIQVAATVLTPELLADAERVIAGATALRIGQPVKVVLTQYRVGTDKQAAEEALLTAALEQQEADLEHATGLAQRLALIAGVPDSEVLIDRDRRRAVVTARPLDGASLSAYAELERRIAAGEEEWKISLVPPARPLPEVEFDEEGALTPAGQRALNLIVWACQRITAPIVLSGPEEQVEVVRSSLVKADVDVRVGETRRQGPVTAEWAAPGE